MGSDCGGGISPEMGEMNDLSELNAFGGAGAAADARRGCRGCSSPPVRAAGANDCRFDLAPPLKNRLVIAFAFAFGLECGLNDITTTIATITTIAIKTYRK